MTTSCYVPQTCIFGYASIQYGGLSSLRNACNAWKCYIKWLLKLLLQTSKLAIYQSLVLDFWQENWGWNFQGKAKILKLLKIGALRIFWLYNMQLLMHPHSSCSCCCATILVRLCCTNSLHYAPCPKAFLIVFMLSRLSCSYCSHCHPNALAICCSGHATCSYVY